MNEDTQDFIIELMAETIKKLRMQLEATRHNRDMWMANHDKLQEELKKLRNIRNVKRGPGRPKKVKK